MKGLKKIPVFFLLFTLPLFAFTQPVFTVDMNNLDDVVGQIYQLYGSQIGLAPSDVYAFLEPIVSGTVPEAECPPPYPQIGQLGAGSVSFNWDSIPSAEYYGHYYLNLNTNDNLYENTAVPGVAYNGLQGLHLFGFHSSCGDNNRGPSNIIITDIDLIYPDPNDVPPLGQNCFCKQSSETDILYNGYPTGGPLPAYVWTPPGKCTQTKYRLALDADVDDGTTINPYHSELSFIHQIGVGLSPTVIYLMPRCNDNTVTTLHPFSVKDQHDYYNITFNSNYAIIDLINDNDVYISGLTMEVCGCKIKGGNGWSPEGKGADESGGGDGDGRDAEPEFLSTEFKAFPNPISDYTTITYELPEDTEVSLVIFDALGRLMTSLVPQSTQTKGQHQLNVDMSAWPSGIYTCQMYTPQYQKIIQLTKKQE